MRGLGQVVKGTIYGPSTGPSNPEAGRNDRVETRNLRLTQQLKHVIGVLPHMVLISRIISMCREVLVVSWRRTRKHALLNPVLPQVDPMVEPRRVR